MDKKLVAIGDGELRTHSTEKIDAFIRSLVPEKPEGARPYALFVPTASHDSKPYFNTFRKTYTSVLNCKSDVAILTKNEMTVEHCAEKVELADIIYVGGGDTRFLLSVWKETGFDKILLSAYENGKIICGLSAGAICWFQHAHSDYEIMNGGNEYAVLDGLNAIKGICIPHFNEDSRKEDGKKIAKLYETGYGIEKDSAIYFLNGEPEKTIGQTFRIDKGSFVPFEK